ncbi:claudin-3-like [Gambusia affinis]|uniref:claudin-3-like n=1 Tax=Gambusia affinis TaxID=33528 RepID=UPI001CDB5240|nr:claudin-3-like [Gambusia affinis]
MVSQGIQLTGIVIASIGWLLDIVVCGLPMWRVSAFVGANIITAQTIWEGLWMSCVVQSTGQMQCKVYDSMLALEQDLQAARAMIVISVLLGICGVSLAIAGGKCTNCIENEQSKAKVCIVSGVLFILAGLLCLIPVSWSANSVINRFYNLMIIGTPQYDLFTMGKIGKEVAGQVISFIGLVLAAVCCGIPMWRVTTYIGANIVTGQVVWDGLWMNCVMQSTGQMQCKLNESLMRLSQDLQAARALVIICLIVGFIGFIITFVGTKCTSCLKKDSSNANVVIIGGCLLILAAILVLIPVCWSAAISVSDFQSPLTIETQKREIGASIYIGWTSTVFLLIGGIILTTSCPPSRPYYPAYGPQMYTYGPPNTAAYGPVYAAPSNQPYTGPYTGSYTGSYVPAKPYAAPPVYSPQPYVRN